MKPNKRMTEDEKPLINARERLFKNPNGLGARLATDSFERHVSDLSRSEDRWIKKMRMDHGARERQTKVFAFMAGLIGTSFFALVIYVIAHFVVKYW